MNILVRKIDGDCTFAQFHENLSQSTKYKKSHMLAIFILVYARFEDFRTFLFIFVSVVKVFVRKELGRLNVPVAGLVLLCCELSRCHFCALLLYTNVL